MGTGAIAGMGSVLTKDIGEYEVWAGNPARLIRKRFNNDVIEQIIESNWWDWDEETLSKTASYFNSIQELLEHQIKGE